MIPTIQYKDFSLYMHDGKRSAYVPIRGHIEVTFRCNLKCVHCYTSCYNKKGCHDKESTFLDTCKILDQISDAGGLWLSFTGGEPFVRKEFLDIYTYAKKKGFLITIFTNGTLLTSEITDYLLQHPPFSIEVTLHGVTQRTYESITGVPGSFKKCVHGIDLIMERGLPLKLKTQLTTLNYHEFDEIENYANSLNIPYSFDPVLYPGLDGSLIPCQYRLSGEQISKTGHQSVCGMGNRIKENVITCANGINSFFIDPYGNTVFCNLIRKPSISLKEMSFMECFDKLYPYVRGLKYKTDSRCRICNFSDSCRRCPGIAQLECGSLESPVEYFCEEL